LPQSSVESTVLAISAKAVPLEELSASLRRGVPPVIGYIAGDRFRLDLRTIFPRQDEDVIRAIRAVFDARAEK
jgi:L-seryl-tRNA(Ser) seleniumtransferase